MQLHTPPRSKSLPAWICAIAQPPLPTPRNRTALPALELVRCREDFARQLREAAELSQRSPERARVADVHAARRHGLGALRVDLEPDGPPRRPPAAGDVCRAVRMRPANTQTHRSYQAHAGRRVHDPAAGVSGEHRGVRRAERGRVRGPLVARLERFLLRALDDAAHGAADGAADRALHATAQVADGGAADDARDGLQSLADEREEAGITAVVVTAVVVTAVHRRAAVVRHDSS